MVANYTEFINSLNAATGLDKSVLAAWVGRENGAYNNALGLTYQTGSKVPVGEYIKPGTYLGSFTSQTQAATETARWINTFPQYAGIRNAAKSGTPAQQALAIVNSPWRTGSTTGDPYYRQGFIDAGILGSSGAPSGGASTPLTPSPSDPIAIALTALQDKLKGIGISSDPNHQISNAESLLIADKLYNVKGDIAVSIAKSLEGRTVLDIATQAASGKVTDVSRNKIDLPNLDIPGALIFIAVILVGVTFLGLGGVVMLKGKK